MYLRFKTVRTTFCLIAFAFISNSLADNIFGEVNRAVVQSFSFPLNRIGILYLPSGGYCTGSMVGADLVLTAAHCISKDGLLVQGDYRFYLPDGSGATIERFTWGGFSGDRSKDWAILKLSQALVDADSVFQMGRGATESTSLSIAGYGSAFVRETMTLQTGCRFRSTFGPDADGDFKYYHDCDAGPGDSGAPMYTCKNNAADKWTCRIHAVHVAAYQDGQDNALTLTDYTDAHANVATSVESFRADVESLRAAH